MSRRSHQSYLMWSSARLMALPRVSPSDHHIILCIICAYRSLFILFSYPLCIHIRNDNSRPPLVDFLFVFIRIHMSTHPPTLIPCGLHHRTFSLFTFDITSDLYQINITNHSYAVPIHVSLIYHGFALTVESSSICIPLGSSH